MVHDKLLRVSSATNKTISSGKFMNIANDDIHAHIDVMTMGPKILQAFLTLFYCTYGLYELVGYACFMPWLFVAGKMGFDLSTRKWRDSTWNKVSKAKDSRSNEISQTFKNIKTLKLYAW